MLVAEGQYVILSFASHSSMDRLLPALKGIGEGAAGAPGKAAAPAGKSSKGGGLSSGLQTLSDVNHLVRTLRLVLEVRVGGKTYLTFGGPSYKISFSAVLGTIGSFLRKL